MTLNEIRERLEADISLMRHYWDNEQWWRLAVALSKIQHYARESEWQVNDIINKKEKT